MRDLLTAVVAVVLLAAPSLGVFNVSLTADKMVIDVGESTVVHVMAQGTSAGVAAIGGSTFASGTDGALTSTGPMVFYGCFAEGGPFGLRLGTADANGGWASFGSAQHNQNPWDPTVYKAALGEVSSYTITGTAPGTVTLAFKYVGVTGAGYKCVETDGSTEMGTLTPVTIQVTPEPVTLSLLALGGLLLSRRRRA